MRRRAPRCTRTGTLFTCTTLFRSLFRQADAVTQRQVLEIGRGDIGIQRDRHRLAAVLARLQAGDGRVGTGGRSEEHTSELQSLIRISYVVFCLKHTNIILIPTTSNRIVPAWNYIDSVTTPQM